METSPSCTSMTALCRDLSVSTTGTRSGLLVLFVWFPKVTFNWKRGLCNAHLLPPAVAIRSVLSSYSSNDCKLFPTVTELRSRMQSRHLCNQASSVDVETAERIQNVGRLQEDGFCSAESAVWKWNKGRGAPSLKLGRDTFFSLASWPFVLLSPNGSTRPEKAAMHTETCYSLNHARLPSRCWRSRAYTSPIDEMKSFTRFFFFFSNGAVGISHFRLLHLKLFSAYYFPRVALTSSWSIPRVSIFGRAANRLEGGNGAFFSLIMLEDYIFRRHGFTDCLQSFWYPCRSLLPHFTWFPFKPKLVLKYIWNK